MLAVFLQLTFAFAFIAAVCFGVYKLMLPICLKIIGLCFDSHIFRKGVGIFLAVAFFAVGIMQLIDFRHEIEHGASRFFPLSFLASALFIFLLFRMRKNQT